MKWMITGRSTAAVKEVAVYFSRSRDVYANLAFEDWVYQNVDLTRRKLLFLWSNLPCVVIGRHQNPWQECNVSELRQKNIPIARRKSGGGAVYHDLGNLNLTIFTDRNNYDRQRNLELVAGALNRRYPTHLTVNERHDIICKDTWKVSGSSSKLGKNSAYHHFTLLLNTSLSSLRNSLLPNPQLSLRQSSSTESVRSKVANLCDVCPELDFTRVYAAVAQDFYSAHGVKDGKIIEVNPASEDGLNEIDSLCELIKEWEWMYGKTPKFAVSCHIPVNTSTIDVQLEVAKGRIEGCHFTTGNNEIDITQLQQHLIGCRLGRKIQDQLITSPLHHHSCQTTVGKIIQWFDSIF